MHNNQNSLEFIYPNWNVSPKIKSLITTRTGGLSTAPYDGFNLASHVGDNLEHVLKNRQLLANYLPNSNITWLNQTHSNNIIELDHKTTYNNHECDASFTNKRHIICAILTADCLPILVTNFDETIVGAIHAGWKGVANGIIPKSIHKINNNYIDNKYLKIFIGPSISQKNFQVDKDIVDLFCNLDKDNSKFFLIDPNNPDKYLGDIIGIAKLQLIKLGILEDNIYTSNICTFDNTHILYSFRKNNITGRFASLIWID